MNDATMNVDVMLNELNKFGSEKRSKIIQTEIDKVKRLEDQIERIKAMSERIKNVIALGTAIINNDLREEYADFCSNPKYVNKYHGLMASGVSHNLGLCRLKSGAYALSVKGGGYCGIYDLFVEPTNIYYLKNNIPEEYTEPIKMVEVGWHLQTFLEQIDNYENGIVEFINYLNKYGTF